MVRINLEDTYELTSMTPDLREAAFYSCNREGNPVLLNIQLKPALIELLPDVYNLGFGPLLPDAKIDDSAKIPHHDLNRMFSTIILFALKFLTGNPTATVGLDGSDDMRAYLYHRMFISNRIYLSEYFTALGVDWFVRLLRNGDYERNEDGAVFFKPKPESFDYQRPAWNLYRYYVFRLKKDR